MIAPSDSAFLNPTLVHQAIMLVEPAIRNFLKLSQEPETQHFVIISVLVKKNDFDFPLANVTVCLEGEKVPPQESWAYPFDRLAVSKAKMSLETGLDTRVLSILAPAMLKQGETFYEGGANGGGYGVGSSGVEAYLDDRISHLVAVAINCLLRYDLETVRENDFNFVPTA